MKQPSFWLLAAPRVCRPAEGDQKVQTFHRCCKCLFKNNRTRTHWLRSRKLMCIPASESLPSPRVLQHHCAAAPFCTTTNEAQHGNVMGNCVRRLPSMQRSRISLEAAPRLLPSGFSMNEPGCCRGEQGGEGEQPQEMHAENQPCSTSHPTTQNRLRKAQTKRAPLTTDNHLHLTLISAGFAFLGGISQDCNVEESIHLPHSSDAVSSGPAAVEEN